MKQETQNQVVPTQQLMPTSVFPPEVEWKTMREMAATIARDAGTFLPKAVDSAGKVLAIFLKARELGMPPMQALSSIHIVEGKPTMSAEGMRALVLSKMPGASFDYIESTDKKCVIEATRPGNKKPVRREFTWENAVRAGVTNKDNWRKYPQEMLLARCTAAICRMAFPDVIAGMYDPEELGVELDDKGNVLLSGEPSTKEQKAKNVTEEIANRLDATETKAAPPVVEANPAPVVPTVEATPVEQPKPKRTKKEIADEILTVAAYRKLSDRDLADLAGPRYAKSTKLMTEDELEDFLQFLQTNTSLPAGRAADSFANIQ